MSNYVSTSGAGSGAATASMVPQHPNIHNILWFLLKVKIYEEFTIPLSGSIFDLKIGPAVP